MGRLEELYLANVATITRMAEHACRRYRLRREEVEDFVQGVHLKIINNDYAVLGNFRGKCSLNTYLNFFIQSKLKDHLDHLWGKWRPTALAVRLGDPARRLDELLRRDRLGLSEACQKLRAEGEVKETDRELEELAARLRPRWPGRRGQVAADPGGSDPEGCAAPGRPEGGAPPLGATVEGTDERLWGAERARHRRRLLAALAEALAALPDEDRLILRMWSEGFTVAAIARRLGLEQKPLYPRLERLRLKLRQALEKAGFSAEDVDDILDHPDDDADS